MIQYETYTNVALRPVFNENTFIKVSAYFKKSLL